MCSIKRPLSQRNKHEFDGISNSIVDPHLSYRTFSAHLIKHFVVSEKKYRTCFLSRSYIRLKCALRRGCCFPFLRNVLSQFVRELGLSLSCKFFRNIHVTSNHVGAVVIVVGRRIAWQDRRWINWKSSLLKRCLAGLRAETRRTSFWSGFN